MLQVMSFIHSKGEDHILSIPVSVHPPSTRAVTTLPGMRFPPTTVKTVWKLITAALWVGHRSQKYVPITSQATTHQTAVPLSPNNNIAACAVHRLPANTRPSAAHTN